MGTPITATTSDLSALLKEHRVNFTEEGRYWRIGRPAQAEGWTLYLSVIPTQLTALLREVFPLIKKTGLSFKVIKSKDQLISLNNALYGNEQLGRAVAVFLDDATSRMGLISALLSLTNGKFTGPRIYYDFRLGDVLYTRYGAFHGRYSQGEGGQSVQTVHDGPGNPCRDRYTIPVSLPAGIPNPFSKLVIDALTSEKPTHIGEWIFPSKILQPHIRGNVYKAVYFNRFLIPGWCIVKEGRTGVLPDKNGRDICDRLKWQDQVITRMRSIVPTPAVIGFYQDKDRSFLALRYVKSRPLAKISKDLLKQRAWWTIEKRSKEKLLRLLIGVIEIVQDIHVAGYFHRDINGNNFLVTAAEKIYTIDWEMSHAFKEQLPVPPFGKGTRGFVSPAQNDDQKPVAEDDTYSVGATIAFILTGVEPVLLADEDPNAVYRRLLLLLQDAELAGMLSRAMDHVPSNRPSLEQIKAVLSSRNRLKATNTITDRGTASTNEQVQGVIQSALAAIGSNKMAKNGLWFSINPANGGKGGLSEATTIEIGLNTGLAGVIYGYAKARQAGLRDRAVENKVSKALQYLQDNVVSKPVSFSPGLHYGTAGVGLAIAECLKTGLTPPTERTITAIMTCCCRENPLLDVMTGLAGQGVALLSLLEIEQITPGRIQKHLDQIVQRLVAAQRRDGAWETITSEGQQAVFTGQGNGVAGIVTFLVEYAKKFDSMPAIAATRKGLAYLQKTAINHKGNLHWQISNKNSDQAPGWQQGTAGIALAFLKGYSMLQEEKWKAIATKALAGLPPYIVIQDFTQLMGMSGIGEIYLEALHITGDPEWRRRAAWVRSYILEMRYDDKDGCWWYSDFENSRFPLAGYLRGSTGITTNLFKTR